MTIENAIIKSLEAFGILWRKLVKSAALCARKENTVEYHRDK